MTTNPYNFERKRLYKDCGEIIASKSLKPRFLWIAVSSPFREQNLSYFYFERIYFSVKILTGKINPSTISENNIFSYVNIFSVAFSAEPLAHYFQNRR